MLESLQNQFYNQNGLNGNSTTIVVDNNGTSIWLNPGTPNYQPGTYQPGGFLSMVDMFLANFYSYMNNINPLQQQQQPQNEVMTPKKAAETLKQNMILFDVAAGKGKRDNLVGITDLEAVASDPNVPTDVRNAALYLLTNKSVFNSFDQASGKGKPDNLIGNTDLDAIINNYPDKLTTTNSDFNTMMTPKQAAETLKQNMILFDVAAGKGKRDNLVGITDLQAVANDPNSPADVKQAAIYLLTNKSIFNSFDQASGKGKPDDLIGNTDLDAIIKNYTS